MKPASYHSDKIAEEGGPAERGHEAFKRAKVERGLAEAKDRAAMIPAERVWRDLGQRLFT